MAHIVKFVVPKGTIEEATLKILEEAWQKISGRARTYRIKLSNPEIEVKLLRPQEIPTYYKKDYMMLELLEEIGLKKQMQM